MRALVAAAVAVAAVGAGTLARADTVLVHVTPRNLETTRFQVAAHPREKQVEFVIRRDVSGIDGPGTRGYVSNLAAHSSGLGTPVKLKKDGDLWTFRFSVRKERVAKGVFTLWGQGLRGEGITYRFNLTEFWRADAK